MRQGVYLSANNDQEGFRLPINPEKINVSFAGDGEKFAISKLGKVYVQKDVELEEFELSSYFPASKHDPYLINDFKNPQFYIDAIKRWRKAKVPVRYIYVDGSFTINKLVTIERFNYDETGGSADVNYTLSLVEYVPFAPKKMVVKKTAKTTKTAVVKNKSQPRQNKKTVPQTYTIVKGDSLWKVAQKYTGNGINYIELAKLNNIKPSQYRKLPIGLKLKIPPSWAKK